MPLETIGLHWRPCKKTSNTLKSDKYGYTQDQVNDLGKQFIQRYLNKQLPDANHKFFEFVRSSGVGHKMPKPDRTQEIAQDKKRLADIENRAEDSKERAEELQKLNDGAMSQDDLNAG